jgi:glycosyltransferase involved in cell wall biosynthesis
VNVTPTRLTVYTDSTQFGGAEQSVATLLAELDESFSVTLLAASADVAAAVATARPGTGVELVPSVRDKYDVRSIRAHLAAVRRLRPHILHVNMWWPWKSQYAAAAGVATPGVRVVMVEHGSPHPSSDAPQRWAKSRLVRRIDAYVNVGERSARELERQLRLPGNFVRTIHNGVADVRGVARSRAEDRPVIGSIGRMAPEKGFEYLVRALPRIPDARLVLVGSGPHREGLIGLARELGVAERVELPGRVEDTSEWLASFDVFVLPSLMENFPLVNLEAMFAERPVVASDVGCVSEAVAHGETGLLVPPGDPERLAAAISELLANPERAREMGRRGREQALARFTTERMKRAYEGLYRELLGGRAAA